MILYLASRRRPTLQHIKDTTKVLLYRQCFHCEMKPRALDLCHVIPEKSSNVNTPSIFLLTPSTFQPNESCSNSTTVILRMDS